MAHTGGIERESPMTARATEQTTGQIAAHDDLVRAIDTLLADTYATTEPGAAVLVAREGHILYRTGIGMANLELGVAIEPHMVFRLGSITKQFTAVSILMLMEQGKLSLDDDITTFLPDYPTQGHRVTVEHLLTHTSGIKSYTEMTSWPPLWRTDMTLQELIDFFKNEPLVFAPGERWSYNNSGYVLLGAIVEAVSELSYEEFLQRHIFEPLGMTHSCYDHTDRIVPGRVAGYQKGAAGLENASFLSMTQPHAAGALLSSVDDLLLWDEALYTDRLVSQETLRRAFTPARLNDGTATGYGYGWAIGSYEGHRLIVHGGGINGFLTDAIRLPDDHIYVAVLTNRMIPDPLPDQIALKIAALAIGTPYREPVAVTLDPARLDAYVGVYQDDRDEQVEQIVTRDGDHLRVQRTGGAREEILPLSQTEFFFKNNALFFDTRLHMEMEGDSVTALVVRGRYGPAERASKTDKPLPQARQAIAVDPALYQRYVGAYELAPGMAVTVSREGDRLMVTLSGQAPAEVLPESERLFFLTVVDAQIEFVLDDSGDTSGLILHQGGQDIPARKVS